MVTHGLPQHGQSVVLPVSLLALVSYITGIAVYSSVHICSPHASQQQGYGMFTQVIRDSGHLSPGVFQSQLKGLFSVLHYCNCDFNCLLPVNC